MPLRRMTTLRDRFIVLGISKNLAGDLASTVSRWVEASGENWTVERLKLLKTSFLRRIAGEPYQLPFVATRKDALGAVPKGPFGVLWKQAGTDITSISRVLNALMVYSTFKSSKVTESQWKKFHDSMTRLPSPEDDRKIIIQKLRVPEWLRVDKKIGLTSFEEFAVTHGLSVRYVNEMISSICDEDTTMALWERYPQYKAIFQSVAMRNLIDTRVRMDDYFGYHDPLDPSTTHDPVGKLGCTQEPGYKLRVFASPNKVHQIALSRLKSQLFALLQKCNWDCTFNQSSGTDWARGQLNQGKELWSVDLSDATNNFPLDVQLHVLRKLGCDPDDIGLFAHLSRAPWISNIYGSFKGRWTQGQPLGLGPSFAAFALSHGLVVRTIALRHSVKDAFRVLGDDIIISDGNVASEYIQTLASLGIPISKDKTIQSTTHAEFAGKVITRDGILATLKWRDPSDRSFLDVVRLLGPRAFGMLNARQRRVATFVSVLPEPRGFGWNPQGISLAKRLQLLEAVQQASAEKVVSFYPLQSRWQKIDAQMEQPFLRMRFPVMQSGELTAGKAVERHSRHPRPVGGAGHQLSISEMTGCPLRLTNQMLEARINERSPTKWKDYIRQLGFTTSTTSTDPRGMNPLEDWEKVIARCRPTLDQLGLSDLAS